MRLQRFQVADQMRRFTAGEVIDALIEPALDPRLDLRCGVALLLADGKNGGNLLLAGAVSPWRCAVGLCGGMRSCSRRHGREWVTRSVRCRCLHLVAG